MAIQGIHNLFAKYAKLAIPDKEAREAIVASIEKHTSIVLPLAAIQLKGDAAFIRTNAVRKTQILLHQEEILSDVGMVVKKPLVRII